MLADGLAASLYRDTPRLTTDVDIALAANPLQDPQIVAERLIREVGYVPALGWIDTSRLGEQAPVVMVIGRKPDDDFSSTRDILLPALPWVSGAVERAQFNRIDFGFARIPTITPEDLIIAKVCALKAEPDRFQDLDDIKAILARRDDLDFLYITEGFARLSLSLPRALKRFAPKALKRLR